MSAAAPATPDFRLPYAFAKAHGIILGASDPGRAEVMVRQGTPVSAIAETRRILGVPLQLIQLDTARFERQLAEAYSRADQTAAEVADDIGQEMDLSRLVSELPPIEDLLESEDDAPIIRMINALFTQAVREGASRAPPPPEPSRELDPEEHGQRERVVALLRLHAGNVTAVARELGLPRTNLQRLMARLGIGRPDGG